MGSGARVRRGALGPLLELFGCVDQLDLSNLAGAEVLCLQFQWRETQIRLRTDKDKAWDGSEFYLGRARKARGALQDPKLAKFIAGRAAVGAAVLKETRKAAEEKRLARAKAAGK